MITLKLHLLLLPKVESSLYSCPDNDWHSPQIIGDNSGQIVINDIGGPSRKYDLILCGKTSSASLIAAGVEQKSCGGSISAQSSVPFVIITGEEADMNSQTNIETLVGFAAMNLDDAAQGQPSEYLKCAAAQTDQNAFLAVTENPVQIHSLMPFSGDQGDIYYLEDSSGNLLDSSYQIVGLTQKAQDLWVVAIQGPVELTMLINNSGDFLAKTFRTGVFTFYGYWNANNQFNLVYDDGTNVYMDLMGVDFCAGSDEPYSFIFALSDVLSGDTLTQHVSRFAVGFENISGGVGTYYQSQNYDYLQRLLYDDGNTYEMLCVIQGDFSDLGNGFLAFDSVNNLYLFVSTIHTGGNTFSQKYIKFLDISSYNFGTNHNFVQFRNHAIAGLTNTNNYADTNYGGANFGLLIFNILDLQDCGPVTMTVTDGSDSNISFNGDITGATMPQTDIACFANDSSEISLHSVTDFCIDSYSAEAFVQFSCSYQFEKEATDPFSYLSYVLGEAAETTALTNYNVGCDATTSDLTLSFHDSALNDMVATYSWFTTSGNTFTIDPTDGTFGAGTWEVTVTASYYMSQHTASITEDTFVFDLEALGSGNMAPVITSHDCTDASVTVESSITCTFSAYSDPDVGDTLTLSVQSGQTWVSVSGDIFTFAPDDNSLAGDNEVVLRITDDNSSGQANGVRTASVSVAITVLPLNHAPTIDSTDCTDSSVYVGLTYSCEINFTDQDESDTISYSFNPATSWASVSSTTVSFSPTFNSQAGVHSIEIILSDDNSLGASNGVLTTSITITVTVIEGNSAPVITGTDCATSSIDVGSVYSCSITSFTDEQVGDSHTYGGSGDYTSSFMSVSGNTLTISPTSNEQMGDYDIDFYIQDDNSVGSPSGELQDSTSFTLTINQGNSVPEITKTSCTGTIYVGVNSSTYCKLRRFHDDDDTDSLSFSLPDGLSWTSYNSKRKRVYFRPTDDSQIGTYTVEIKLTDDNSLGGSNGVQSTSLFVTVIVISDNSAPYFTSNTCSDHEMMLGETWQCSTTFTDPDETDTLTFSVRPISLDWIFTTDNGLATFFPSEGGTFSLFVQIRDDNSLNGAAGRLLEKLPFTLSVLVENSEPQFSAELEDYSIAVLESLIVVFPSISDEDQDSGFNYIVEVNGGGVPSFMEVGDGSISVMPTDNSQAGSYKMIIIVEDSPPKNCDCDSLTDEVSFTIDILQSEFETIVDPTVYLLQNLYPYEIFTVPTPEGEEPPKWRLETVSPNGLLTIVFTQKMYGIPNVGQIVNGNVLKLEILHDFDMYKPEEMLVRFEAIKMERNKLEIQLYFKDPVLITAFSDPDKIRAKLLRANIFISIDTDQLLGGEMIKTAKISPQAVAGAAAVVVKGIGDFMSSSGKVTAAVNFGSKFVLSSTLNLLWSLMNTMQIIVHFPMTAISFPSNAISFSSIFLQLCQFDVLPHWLLTDAVFEFLQDNEPLHLHYFNASFETNNFVLNAGSAFWFLVIYLILVMFTIVLLKVARPGKLQKLSKNLQNSLFYAFIIRLMIEGYIDYLLSVLLQVQASTGEFKKLNIENYKSGDTFAFYSAFIILALIILFSVFALFSTTIGYRKVYNDEIKHKYLELISGLDESKMISRLYIVFFLFRRLIFAIVVIFRPEDAGFQIIAINYTSFLTLAYLLNCKPFALKTLNMVEIANESTVLLLSYFLLCFSDFNPQPALKQNLGYLYSTLFTAIMALNFCYISKGVVKKVVNKCKKKKSKTKDLNPLQLKVEHWSKSESQRELVVESKSGSNDSVSQKDNAQFLMPAKEVTFRELKKMRSISKVAQMPLLKLNSSMASQIPLESTMRITSNRRVMKPKKKKKKKLAFNIDQKEVEA